METASEDVGHPARVERWARTRTDPEDAASVVAAASEAIEQVIAALVRAGALSDAGFAQGRARTLLRNGRSRGGRAKENSEDTRTPHTGLLGDQSAANTLAGMAANWNGGTHRKEFCVIQTT